jgi:hypothetical protein
MTIRGIFNEPIAANLSRRGEIHELVLSGLVIHKAPIVISIHLESNQLKIFLLLPRQSFGLVEDTFCNHLSGKSFSESFALLLTSCVDLHFEEQNTFGLEPGLEPIHLNAHCPDHSIAVWTIHAISGWSSIPEDN